MSTQILLLVCSNPSHLSHFFCSFTLPLSSSVPPYFHPYLITFSFSFFFNEKGNSIQSKQSYKAIKVTAYGGTRHPKYPPNNGLQQKKVGIQKQRKSLQMHPISYFPHQFQCRAQIKQFRSGDKFVPYLSQLKTITSLSITHFRKRLCSTGRLRAV